ncbi:DUF2255 family protein [Epilithonimonas hominis]|uniref:DUF2255 family protein n=1 Tax=Epilithonimonas hominis TaxID=420404 RepID=A0A1H6IG00_9FLAO|nr:DUF2255 family protein [Epilithonimonas hominis]SEH48302.1 hypothetical protein SAMN05421793_10692 [Epilithonimonas hominis]
MNTAIQYINSHNLIGIKAGKERETFLEIWMVTVENRIFARSWGFAEKSWYNTFLKDNLGEIKCGETIYKIEARIPEDLSELEEEINQAYLDKYDSGENSFYAKGIIEEKHVAKTMEFVILNDKTKVI